MTWRLLLSLTGLLIQWMSFTEGSLVVVSTSNLYSNRQFGRQIELTHVLPTNESFIINYEEGYFLCPKLPNGRPRKFRLSRVCDGYADCALGSDELSRDLKCAQDCSPKCGPHGLCMRANIRDPKGHCRCDDGWGNQDCGSPNVNECIYRPCGMNAECIDTLDGYECKCLPGFEGNGHKSCLSVDDVLANVRNVLLTDSSQFKDPNVDLSSLDVPSEAIESVSIATFSTPTPISPKPLSIVLPVSPTDVVDKVKEILGNNVRQGLNSEPSDSPPSSLVSENIKSFFMEKSTTYAPFADVPSLRRETISSSSSSPLNEKEEELFLEELNMIQPQISREDPRLVACRGQFESCRDPRESCLKDLHSCSLSVLDVSEGHRGKLWGECIMDHHMCIMNQEPFCMRGFQKCSNAAVEVLRNMLPRKPFAEKLEGKSPRLRIDSEGPFTLSFHFRVCVNGYLDCLEEESPSSPRTSTDCKSDFDGCSLRLLNASSGALTVRTQVAFPGLSECIQGFVECVEREGSNCYADYNACTVITLDDYAATSGETQIITSERTTSSTSTTTIPSYRPQKLTSSISQITTEKLPDMASSIMGLCQPFGAPNRFGSFSGSPAVSTVDCVWDYFSCTKRYGPYPQNKACCDGRFKLCCELVMSGGGHGGSFESHGSTSGPHVEGNDDCTPQLNECLRRGLNSREECNLRYNSCSGGHPSPSTTQRPLSDIDLAKPPGSLKPSGSVTQRPIQDIDLPHNQEFLLQNGDQDPFPSLIGQGEAQVVYAEEEFMACLLEQFDCTENCPTLQRCSELSGVNSVYPGDNFVSGAENPSGVFFLPPVNFSLVELLSSEEDKERMFCVKEFFACKEPALSCKLEFKNCVDRQASFTREELCEGVSNRPENYLVPHPLDCTKFYSCQSLGPGLGYKAHLMDCPFSTGFDRKLKICNFIQSLPRCRRRDSARTARYLSGELLPLKRGRSDSAVHVGQIGYLTSDELISSSTSLLNGGFLFVFLLLFTMVLNQTS